LENELAVELNELTAVARKVAAAYSAKNRAEGRNEWTLESFLAGFVGDVGDLSKLVMAKSGYRHIDAVDEKIAHELSDCLWSILVIADELSLDLGIVYKKEMDALLHRINDDERRKSAERVGLGPS
jgi:NTP pyrophosphatase (non-canonical NTP hydrolase)